LFLTTRKNRVLSQGSRSHSALGAFYRRLRSRLGAPKAITATAHKIARLFYKLWSSEGTYVDPGEDYYEQKYRERLVKHLKKTAQSVGFEVVPNLLWSKVFLREGYSEIYSRPINRGTSINTISQRFKALVNT
jgi:hypothetical protein